MTVAVSVNGEPLVMTKGETELEMVPYVEGGELVMLWQKHREGLGNAVELTTGAHISSSGTLFLHLKHMVAILSNVAVLRIKSLAPFSLSPPCPGHK